MIMINKITIEIKRYVRASWFRLGCAAAIAALTGCAAYIVPPRPPIVFVRPPPVYVEPPRVYVAPPPVYVAPPPPVESPAVVEIRTEADFYQPLSPYGRWEVVERYGRCWIPTRIDAEWRPYCNGRWERTDAGWFWASDEPWGWATYHYGRWDLSPQFGWFWVPQTQWAPAWVSWHHGGGYVGWAPLQPSVRLAVGGPVEVDVKLIPSRAFVFTEEKRFLEPVRPTTVIVNNTTIINKTVNITNIKVVNNTIINEGPRTQIIEQVTGHKVQPVAVHQLRHREEAGIAGKPGVSRVSEVAAPPPVRTQIDVRDVKAREQAEERARELHLKAQEESQRQAKELERKAQLQSEQHARELQAKAQEDARRHAKELERNAQLQAEQHGRELRLKAQEESEKHALELQRNAQLASQQHARELERKAQEDSQKHAKELERTAQQESEQRTRDLHQKAQEESNRPQKGWEKNVPAESPRHANQRQAPPRERGTNIINRGQSR